MLKKYMMNSLLVVGIVRNSQMLAGRCLQLDWWVQVFLSLQLFRILLQSLRTWTTFPWLERILIVSYFQSDGVRGRPIRLVLAGLDHGGRPAAAIAAVSLIQPLQISEELSPDVSLLCPDWFLFNRDVVLPVWACRTKVSYRGPTSLVTHHSCWPPRQTRCPASPTGWGERRPALACWDLLALSSLSLTAAEDLEEWRVSRW